jgi:carboxymethylenebutenolidase
VKDKKQLDAKRPVAPIDVTGNITSPLLGIFGNDDKNPDIAQVNEIEQALKQHGKTYEFHRYDGVGHAFFNTWREGYRAPQALDGWEKVFGFYRRYLASA